jgi:hypothetical protein
MQQQRDKADAIAPEIEPRNGGVADAFVVPGGAMAPRVNRPRKDFGAVQFATVAMLTLYRGTPVRDLARLDRSKLTRDVNAWLAVWLAEKQKVDPDFCPPFGSISRRTVGRALEKLLQRD